MLIDWINDVLVGERIIVKDLAEDLYDGQVLQKLFGKTLNILFDVTLTMMLKQAWYVLLSLCEFT